MLIARKRFEAKGREGDHATNNENGNNSVQSFEVARIISSSECLHDNKDDIVENIDHVKSNDLASKPVIENSNTNEISLNNHNGNSTVDETNRKESEESVTGNDYKNYCYLTKGYFY